MKVLRALTLVLVVSTVVSAGEIPNMPPQPNVPAKSSTSTSQPSEQNQPNDLLVEVIIGVGLNLLGRL
jgi:hypothetical protein